MEYNPIIVKIPASKAGIFNFVCSSPVTTPASAPAAKASTTKEEPHTVNPTEARTAKPSQSVPSSKNSPDSKDRSADERTLAECRPSVRKELKEIREEMDREKKTKGKSKNSPNKTAEHKALPKKKKSKER